MCKSGQFGEQRHVVPHVPLRPLQRVSVVTGRCLPGGSGRGEAADGGELKALREVPDRQILRAKQFLCLRSGEAGAEGCGSTDWIDGRERVQTPEIESDQDLGLPMHPTPSWAPAPSARPEGRVFGVRRGPTHLTVLHIMSISNADSEQSPTSDVDKAMILDAARACVEDFGVKRTTLAEVARRAGVSRPTVYRRWPDTRTLLGELLNRELRSTVMPTELTGSHGRAQLVHAVVGGAAAIRANPLFQKIFRTDSDLMLTYIIDRAGRSQVEVLHMFGVWIRNGQADGSIRAGNPDELATMLLLIVQSAVQSAQIFSATLSGVALDAELAHAIDGYLRTGGETE